MVHSAPIDPYRLVYVDPDDIVQSMVPFDAPNRKIAGKIIGGSWDRMTYEFRNRDGEFHMYTLESFERRFHNGWEWEETKYYQTVLERITGREDPSLVWGCKDEADLRERCEMVDSLYDTIKTDGYKTQSEIAGDNRSDPMDTRSRPESYRKINGEVAVNIARDGTYIFYDGRHRLAIAKLLELEAIPVVVLVRHEMWQSVRDAIWNEDTDRVPDRFVDHSDIRTCLTA